MQQGVSCGVLELLLCTLGPWLAKAREGFMLLACISLPPFSPPPIPVMSMHRLLPTQVQRAVAALAEIEGALAALLPNPAHHASLLARAPGVSAPASTQACAWHEAAVACLAAADLPALAHFVQGLYTSQVGHSSRCLRTRCCHATAAGSCAALSTGTRLLQCPHMLLAESTALAPAPDLGRAYAHLASTNLGTNLRLLRPCCAHPL